MMHPLTKLAANLYPRWWRDRYGEEFAALLEEARPGLGGTLDVLKGALAMRLSTPWSWKPILFCAVLGPIIGLAVTYVMTPQYSSSAVVSIRPPQDPTTKESGASIDIVDEINQLSREVMSRTQLMNFIRNFDLYRLERNQMPNEDVLELMRGNIHISAAPAIVGGRAVPAFQVSFQYTDPRASQKVVNALVSGYLDTNVKARYRETYQRGQPLPPGPTMEVLDPASLPTNPSYPQRKDFAAVGLGSGILLGALVTLALYFRRKLQPAGAEFASLPEGADPGIAETLSVSEPAPAVVAWKFPLAGAALGTIIGLVIAYLMTSQYSSTATILIVFPGHGGRIELAPTITRLLQQAFSREELSGLIRNLNLYSEERARMTNEDVLELVKQNIRLTAAVPMVGKRGPALELSFTHPNRFDAQRVTANLATRLIDANLKLAMDQPGQATRLQIMDRASLPSEPIYPNRLAIAFAGLGAGTLFGGIFALFRRKRQPA
jgi:uncharacterized protein involved in exopolysaccharide biosynthesis